MALIASKVCQYIRPDSVSNSDAEAYEYYLVWLGVDGGVYSWLFEDFTRKKNINGEVVNTKSDNITKLYRNANQSIELIAEDLTENEFDTICDITRALVVRRYFTDGTFSNLAILTDNVEKPKSQFRYDLELEVAEVEEKIMR
jgi:hypothetical protein